MNNDDDFFDRPKVRKTLVVIFAVMFIGLLVADFRIDKHDYFYWDGIPGFYALLGLAGSLALLLIANYVRRFIEREEKYYD